MLLEIFEQGKKMIEVPGRSLWPHWSIKCAREGVKARETGEEAVPVTQRKWSWLPLGDERREGARWFTVAAPHATELI